MKAHEKILPLPINGSQDNFARRVWWRGSEMVPAASMRTTVSLRPGLAALQDQPWQILAAVCRAASAALTLHPRLNFYTFWGRLYWAGMPPRLSVFLENPDTSCRSALIANAHEMSQAQVIALLRACRPDPLPTKTPLRERVPELFYLVERLSGVYQKNYMRYCGPLFVSMVWLDGLEDPAFTPSHSMALYPGTPRDGRMQLTMCFNHQLANGRPVGRLLLTIRDLLQ